MANLKVELSDGQKGDVTVDMMELKTDAVMVEPMADKRVACWAVLLVEK